MPAQELWKKKKKKKREEAGEAASLAAVDSRSPEVFPLPGCRPEKGGVGAEIARGYPEKKRQIIGLMGEQ